MVGTYLSYLFEDWDIKHQILQVHHYEKERVSNLVL